jgi:aminocarboxymuconate-semialdehyde decarboxylase
MPGRRKFLKSLAGASLGFCFVNCGLTRAAAAAQQSVATPPKRRRVMLGGRPARTIDIHAHCYVDLQDLIQGHPEALVPNGGPPTFDGPFLSPTKEVDARLRHMDEHGIDIQAVSLAPAYNYWADRDLAPKIVSRQNDQIAALCAAHPDRFVGLGGLALQHPDLAVEQMDHCVKQLGFRGFEIGGSVNGDELANPKFNPVWAKAEELGIFFLLHPATFVEGLKRFQGNGFLPNVIGNPLETTVAFSHLIFEGTLDRFPGLKVIAAHGGGYLASYADRSDHPCTVGPKGCNPDIKLKKKPTEYLKQLYFDSLVFTPEAIRHLAAQVGASQIMLGSDYPYPWQLSPVDHIFASISLSDDEKADILGRTAAKLFNLEA